jgi:hypothetical protein
VCVVHYWTIDIDCTDKIESHHCQLVKGVGMNVVPELIEDDFAFESLIRNDYAAPQTCKIGVTA